VGDEEEDNDEDGRDNGSNDDDDEDGEDDEDGSAAAAVTSLLGGSSSLGRTAQLVKPFSEAFVHKREYLNRAILEVAVVCSSALLHILPVLATEFGNELSTARQAAIRTVGQIFALPVLVQATGSSGTASDSAAGGGKIPLGKAYDAYMAAFLQRFRDKEPLIRRDMCILGGEVLRAHPQALGAALAGGIEGRLADPHDDVRLQAVMSACDAAVTAFAAVPVSMLEAVAGRVSDRRFEIRKEAITGLTQAFATHMPPLWTRIADHEAGLARAAQASFLAERTAAAAKGAKKGAEAAALSRQSLVPLSYTAPFLLPPAAGGKKEASLGAGFRPSAADFATVMKLRVVPDRLVSCYSEHAEQEMRSRALQLIDSIALPEALSEGVRMRGLLAFYASLGSQGKRGFHAMLADRKAVQTAVQEFLSARQELREAQRVAAKSSLALGAAGTIHSAFAASRKAAAASASKLGDASDFDPSSVDNSATEAAASAQVTAAIEAAKGRLARSLEALAEKSGQKAKAAVALHTLAHGVADARVFKLLRVLCDASMSSVDIFAARDDLLARLKALGSQSVTTAAAGSANKASAAKGASKDDSSNHSGPMDYKQMMEVTRGLVRRMTMTTVSASSLRHLIQTVHSAAFTDNAADALSGLQLLQTLAALFPAMFTACVNPSSGATVPTLGSSPAGIIADGSNANKGSDSASREMADVSDAVKNGAFVGATAFMSLLALCRHGDSSVAAASLKVLEMLGAEALTALASPLVPKNLTSDTQALLVSLCTKPGVQSVKMAKHAMRAGLRIFGDATAATGNGGFISSMVAEFTKSGTLSTGNTKNLAAMLASLASFALVNPMAFALADGSPLPSMDPSKPAQGGADVQKHALINSLLAVIDADAESDLFDLSKPGKDAKSGSKRRRNSESGDDGDGGSDGNDSDFEGGPARKKDAKRSKTAEGFKQTTKPTSASVAACNEANYRAIPVNESALVRILALKALSAISLGLVTLATETAKAASVSGNAATISFAKAVMQVGMSRVPPVFDRCFKVIAAGGDVFHPRTKTSMAATKPRAGADEDASEMPEPTVSTKSAEDPGYDTVINENAAAALRLAAAVIVVKVLSVKAYQALDSKLVTVQSWRAFASLLLDINPVVRSSMLSLLQAALSSYALPLRYLSLPALAMLDPRAHARKQAKEALQLGCRSYRSASLQAKTAGNAFPFSLMPEFSLPFLLFFLSHDAQRFPSEAAAKAFLRTKGTSSSAAPTALTVSGTAGAPAGASGTAAFSGTPYGPFGDQAACLSALLDAVVQSASTVQGSESDWLPQAGSMSLLFAIFAKVRACDDAVSPARHTPSLHSCADLAFQVLKSKAKDSAAFAPFPGDIPVPLSFFTPREHQPHIARNKTN
jgi:hypothetical protein